MTKEHLTELKAKYKKNAMCICLLADLEILLVQEKMQNEILNDLKCSIKRLEAILTT